MAELLFMPWCPIDRQHSAGPISLVPFKAGRAIKELDEESNLLVQKALSACVDLTGQPIRNATIVRFKDRPLLADLSEQDYEEARGYHDLVSFSGLACRQLLWPHGQYCNTDCFTLVGQRLGGTGYVSVTTRRREGWAWDVYPAGLIRLSMPIHTRLGGAVPLDEDLIGALCGVRAQCTPGEWQRWEHAISCFNWANTDNPAASRQMEAVLMGSAFQRVLGAKSTAEDVARKLNETLSPEPTILVGTARRRLSQWDGDTTLRYQWMREFYAIRGDYAHGRLMTRRTVQWMPEEHLILAAIAFPLTIKALLDARGTRRLAPSDLAQIDGFERLADEEFLAPPPNQAPSEDTAWRRIIEETTLSVVSRQLAQDPQWRAFVTE